jgi:hypothetical protein
MAHLAVEFWRQIIAAVSTSGAPKNGKMSAVGLWSRVTPDQRLYFSPQPQG